MTPDRRAQIGIVICDFNGWEQTHRCLAYLRASRFQEFTVVVVDHGTTTETREALSRENPQVTRIAGNPELWWTGATNLGVRWVLEQRIPYVMLLNNDCYIKPETIDVLMRQAAEYPEAIIAPVQRDAASGEYVSIAPRENMLLGFPTLSGPKAVTAEMRAKQILPTRLISGGRGVVIPSKVFSRVGLLDEENLPHYGSDHDFYFRCRKAGIPLLVAVEAEVSIDATRTSTAARAESLTWSEFRESLTSTRSHRDIQQARALFKKHYPISPLYLVGLWLFVARYVAVYLLKRLNARVTGRD